MSFIKIKSLLLLGATFICFSFQPPAKGDLVINIGNIKKEKGMLWVGLYDSKENLFKKNKCILQGVKVEKTGDTVITMNNIDFGTYALAIFHDENSNGKLDKNLFGIPKEPYAFANWPASKWRAPFYEELIFDFLESNQIVETNLTTWWDM